MNILYLGNSDLPSTCYHRAKALERLGHQVMLEDPYMAVISTSLADKIHFRTGYFLLQGQIKRWLKKRIPQLANKPDLIWINGGELFGPKAMQFLRTLNVPVVLYNNDDPTGGRDGRRFAMLMKSIPQYDLCTVMREINVQEYKDQGAKKVLRVTMSYDEAVHKPLADLSLIPADFRSEVAFIGTWMRHEKRDEFLLKLIDKGIPISIWGNRWSKSPLWPRLEPYYRGGALGGESYVSAIQGSKICIGMLSKGNRDEHTQRSLEIPYIGALFCAERTPEHLAMYEEGRDAVFWDDADECAQICADLLQDDAKREQIRLNGMKRVRDNKVGNEDICRKVLQELAIA